MIDLKCGDCLTKKELKIRRRNMLSIDNLEDLKITSLKNVIHFKYKDEFYFIYEGKCI